MPHAPQASAEVSRRAVVAGTGVLAAVSALAACSTYGTPTQSAPDAPQAGQSPAGTDQPGGQAAGQAVASTGDVPVGGGVVLAAQEVVITQPTQGTFKAFSATCTHQGCSVDEVSGGTINCPCHGSKFNIADGSVSGGPARRALPQRQITVSGDSIQLA